MQELLGLVIVIEDEVPETVSAEGKRGIQGRPTATDERSDKQGAEKRASATSDGEGAMESAAAAAAEAAEAAAAAEEAAEAEAAAQRLVEELSENTNAIST